MARILEESHWLYEEDIADVNFPRSYNLGREQTAFIKDFRRTAAVGHLKCFVESVRNEDVDKDSETFLVDIGQVEFALKRCEEYIADAKHESIDQDPDVSEDEWNCFCDDYIRLLHKGSGIPNGTNTQSGFQVQISFRISLFANVDTHAALPPIVQLSNLSQSYQK